MSEGYFSISVNEQQFRCSSQMPVLLAMKKQGLQCLPAGCCGGGCGICKVRVLSGTYQTKVMSRAQVSLSEEQNNIALACRILPNSDLVLEKFN